MGVKPEDVWVAVKRTELSKLGVLDKVDHYTICWRCQTIMAFPGAFDPATCGPCYNNGYRSTDD